MPPRLPNKLLAREELLACLREGRAKKVTLLCSAPGTGKTTLLTMWRKSLLGQSQNVAWLTLYPDEANSRQLLNGIIAAIQHIYPNFGQNLSLAMNAGNDLPEKMVVAILLNDIATDDKENYVLVIDQYESIVGSASEEILSYIIENQPNNLHIVLSSNTTPAIPTVQLQLSSQLMNITTEDMLLNFTSTSIFLQEIAGLDVEENIFRAIYDKTEGWISGLTLISEKVKRLNNIDQTIDNFPENCDVLNNYFDELLNQYSQELIACLLDLSLFVNFSDPLIEYVFDSQSIYEKRNEIRDNNLFLITCRNSYRFIYPFMVYLRKKANHSSKKHLINLHRRASEWYVDNKYWKEAVEHFLELGDTDNAMEYIEHCAMQLVEQSDVNTLYIWLSRLGKDVGAHSTSLKLAEIWALSFLFKYEELDKLVVSIEQDASNCSAEHNAQLMTAIDIVHNAVHTLNDRFDEVSLLDEKLDSNKESLTPWLAGVAWNILSFTNIYSGNISKALQCQNKVALIASEKNVFVKVYSDVLTGLIHFKKAEITEAEYFYQRALDLAENNIGRRSPAASVAIGYLAECLYEKNNYSDVIGLIADRLDLVDDTCTADTVIRSHVTLAKSFNLTGDICRSLDILNRGKQHAHQRGWDRLLAACLAEEISIYLKREDISNARQLLSELKELTSNQLSKGVETEIELYYCIAKAQIDIVEGPGLTSVEPLLKIITKLDSLEWRYQTVPVMLLLVTIYSECSDPEKAMGWLTRAMHIGVLGDLKRTFLDRGEYLYELIKQWLDVNKDSDTSRVEFEYAGQLLFSFEKGIRENQENRVQQSLADVYKLSDLHISRKEHEVIILLSNGLSNKEIAKALSISPGTVKWHLKNIYSKLEVTSRTEAICEAKGFGLLENTSFSNIN